MLERKAQFTNIEANEIIEDFIRRHKEIRKCIIFFRYPHIEQEANIVEFIIDGLSTCQEYAQKYH